MNELSIKDGITELGVTTVDGEQATVSSRKVHEVFDKRHDNVLRDIEVILEKCSKEFGNLNYELSSYKAGTRKYKEYLMTKDGLVMLVMGYKTKKAMKIKESYINQFNQMKKLIKEREFARIEYKPMTEALKEHREKLGKKTSYFHYSNEANMINRIVLGMTSKEYREKHNIDNKEVRDNLAPWQLEAIKELQRTNTDLIKMGLDYQDRKDLIKKKYNYLFDNLQLSE